MYLLYEVAILIGGRIEKHQRAMNPYWDGGEPEMDAADEAEENSIGGDQPGPEMDDEELFAPVDDESPRILKSTPAPSGDEGFVKPDPNDD